MAVAGGPDLVLAPVVGVLSVEVVHPQVVHGIAAAVERGALEVTDGRADVLHDGGVVPAYCVQRFHRALGDRDTAVIPGLHRRYNRVILEIHQGDTRDTPERHQRYSSDNRDTAVTPELHMSYSRVTQEIQQ